MVCDDIDAMYTMYTSGLTLEQVAKECGWSKQHLSKKFRDAGKPTRGYATRHKRTRSLVDGDKSLRQLALDFIRTYRAEKGNAPTLTEISAYLYKGNERNSGNVKQHIVDPLISEGFLVQGGKWKARTLQLAVPQPRSNYDDKGVK